MKITRAVLIALILSLILTIPCSHQELKLSEMSEKKLALVLQELGVGIPDAANDAQFHNLIVTFEENPDYISLTSWTVAAKLFDDVKIAVKKYYRDPVIMARLNG
jgi:hypothetical protein